MPLVASNPLDEAIATTAELTRLLAGGAWWLKDCEMAEMQEDLREIEAHCHRLLDEIRLQNENKVSYEKTQSHKPIEDEEPPPLEVCPF